MLLWLLISPSCPPLYCSVLISLREHLDHYPHYLSSKEVSSISLRYPSYNT